MGRLPPSMGMVGRADLLTWLHGGGGDADGAELFGFAHVPRVVVVDESLPTLDEPSLDADQVGEGQPLPAIEAAGQMAFWSLVEVAFHEPLTPRSSRSAPSLTAADLQASRSRPLLAGPPERPLAAWPRLWARLRRAIRQGRMSGTVDVAGAVARVARHRPLAPMPRRPVHTLPPRVHLWLDRSEHLTPVWRDQDALAPALGQALKDRAGGLAVFTPPDFPALPGLRAGDTVLAVTDEGRLGPPDGRRVWGRIARQLARRGVIFVVLTPCARAVRRDSATLTWEHRAAVPDVDPLLDFAALTLFLQPALMRAHRRQLGLPLEAELRLWRHPSVARAAASGLALHDEAAQARALAFLKDDGADIAARRGLIIALLHQWRSHHPPELAHAETALWAAVDPEGAHPGDVAEAAGFLDRLGGTVRAGSAASRRLAELLSGRLPDATLRHPKLGEAVGRLHALVQAGRSGVPVPETLDMQAVRDTEPAPADVTYWAVRQVGSRLHFAPAATPIWPSAATSPGSPVAVLPARRATLWATAGGRTQYLLGEAVVPLPAGDTLTLQTDAATLTLRRDRPDWAAAVGRDRYGLWADLEVESVRQRLRWIPPGRFREFPAGRPGAGVRTAGPGLQAFRRSGAGHPGTSPATPDRPRAGQDRR